MFESKKLGLVNVPEGSGNWKLDYYFPVAKSAVKMLDYIGNRGDRRLETR